MIHQLNSLYPVRYTAFALCVLGLLAALCALVAFGPGLALVLAVGALGALVAVGVYDLRQTRHAILRNYPVIGHIRFMLEYVRPEVRQYFIESDSEAAPSRAPSAPWSTSAPRASPTTGPSARTWTWAHAATSG